MHFILFTPYFNRRTCPGLTTPLSIPSTSLYFIGSLSRALDVLAIKAAFLAYDEYYLRFRNPFLNMVMK